MRRRQVAQRGSKSAVLMRKTIGIDEDNEATQVIE